MNVRNVRDRVAGYWCVDRLRTPDDVRRLRNVGLWWLFVHADAAATTIPETRTARLRAGVPGARYLRAGVGAGVPGARYLRAGVGAGVPGARYLRAGVGAGVWGGAPREDGCAPARVS